MNKIILFHHQIDTYSVRQLKNPVYLHSVLDYAINYISTLRTKAKIGHSTKCRCLLADNCGRKYEDELIDGEYVDFFNRTFMIRGEKLHNEAGPALISSIIYDMYEDYYLDGKFYTFKDWLYEVKGNQYWPEIMSKVLSRNE